MAMATPSGVRAGMRVVGADRDEVGTVKEARASDFLVDRRMRRDVYVPLTAVRDITGDSIMLMVPAGQVDDQGWPNPPLFGGEEPPPAETAATTTATVAPTDIPPTDVGVLEASTVPPDVPASPPGAMPVGSASLASEYRCSVCGAEFASAEALAEHSRAAHAL
jgi:hypothetical protein